MQTRIRYFSAVLAIFVLLALAACNRKASQSAPAPNANNQAPAGQQSAPATSAPTLDNSAGTPTPVASPKPGAGVSPNYSNAAPAANVQNSAPPSVAAAPQPLIIPAGTSVVVRLQQSLSSASSVSGERFDAVLDQPLVADNQVVVPAGTPVTGHVTVARRSGRLRHPGELGLTLDSVVLGQQRVPILTSSVVVRGASHKKRNWGLIGGGTGGGALIGALAGGGEGALIGGGIGAAAGTTTAFFTGRKDVGFAAERRLTFRLHRDLALQG